MADVADRAQEHMDMVHADQVAHRKPAGPAPTGRCHYCDEVVGDSMRWCDNECRDAWQREQARR